MSLRTPPQPPLQRPHTSPRAPKSSGAAVRPPRFGGPPRTVVAGCRAASAGDPECVRRRPAVAVLCWRACKPPGPLREGSWHEPITSSCCIYGYGGHLCKTCQASGTKVDRRLPRVHAELFKLGMGAAAPAAGAAPGRDRGGPGWRRCRREPRRALPPLTPLPAPPPPPAVHSRPTPRPPRPTTAPAVVVQDSLSLQKSGPGGGDPDAPGSQQLTQAQACSSSQRDSRSQEGIAAARPRRAGPKRARRSQRYRAMRAAPAAARRKPRRGGLRPTAARRAAATRHRRTAPDPPCWIGWSGAGCACPWSRVPAAAPGCRGRPPTAPPPTRSPRRPPARRPDSCSYLRLISFQLHIKGASSRTWVAMPD